MRAVMSFARRKEGALPHIGNGDGAGWRGDSRSVALTPIHGTDSQVRTAQPGGNACAGR